MDAFIQMFSTLFRGHANVYGRHVPENDASGPDTEKKKGKSFTIREPLTPDLYAAHIEGRTSIGAVPIDADSNVSFAAIDIDVYPSNPLRYIRVFDKYNLPFTCFRSKSGGVHAFIFFERPTPAKGVLELLRIVCQVLGLPKNTETFPKQVRLSANAVGNWINLPYYNAEHTTRYAYDYEGNPLAFSKAMQHCMSIRTTVKALKDALSQLPFSPAPPCLQTLYINDEITEASHNRNVFLFNVASYLKARFGDAYAERLALVNASMPDPVTDQELTATVVKSHARGTYSYQCDNPVLSVYCNRELCEKREYGKGGGMISDLTFEKLVQVAASPPYYKWTVNGVEMVFYSEDELRGQDKFINYCIRSLHKCPNKLKAEKWAAVLNKALETMVVEKDNMNLSDDSLFFSYFKEFIEGRAFGSTIGQVAIGKVYKDESKAAYYFNVEAFLLYLESVKQLKGVPLNVIHWRLKSLGCASTVVYDATSKKSVRVWSIRIAALETELKDFNETAIAVTDEQIKNVARSNASTADRLVAAMQQLAVTDSGLLPEAMKEVVNEDFKLFEPKEEGF